MSSFNEFHIRPELQHALLTMKYTIPTPIQEKSIPLALTGRDIIASAQTGTGKTAAFGVPLVNKLLLDSQARALVLAPTRELAEQIAVVLRQLAAGSKHISVAVLIGGVSMGGQRMALQRSPKIIVATPGRLVDHLRSQRKLLAQTKFLVLDEADRMLDMGFAPQLSLIKQALPIERQTLLFSATFPSDIALLAREWLSNPERIAIGTVSAPAAKVNQSVLEVSGDAKSAKVLSELENREGSVLVFARTKRRTDRLASFLEKNGIDVCHIHGDRSQSQRRHALTGFRSGKFRVLVATDIAARGIDVPHIAHVINFDLPVVAEDYLHRIGRTARAGRSGEAVCLVAPEERSLWRAIQRLLGSQDGLPASKSPYGNANRRRFRGPPRRNNHWHRGPTTHSRVAHSQ